MSDIDRLLRWFEEGALVRPAADAPNSVDLSLALASLAGAPDVALTRGAAAIAKAIGPAEHYIFVLVDGLGMNLLESAPESFIGSHVAMELVKFSRSPRLHGGSLARAAVGAAEAGEAGSAPVVHELQRDPQVLVPQHRDEHAFGAAGIGVLESAREAGQGVGVVGHVQQQRSRR